jgi:RNA polymerase sigma-70 factor (ECF subfamily)
VESPANLDPPPEQATSGRHALNALTDALYADLRELAGRYMRRESSDHTFQPTALVHEAFMRLLDQRQVAWRDRSQFLALASQMMRRILVDHARANQTDKRGGNNPRLALEDADPATPSPEVDLVALDDALQQLASISPLQSRIVEMRFFGGLNIEETAEALGIGKRSVDREWACAKAWLFRALGG